jgi:hypothetical protein
MEQAEISCQNENKEGLKLAEKFSYDKTLEGILEIIENNC